MKGDLIDYYECGMEHLINIFFRSAITNIHIEIIYHKLKLQIEN